MKQEWTPPYGYEESAVRPPEFTPQTEQPEQVLEYTELQQEAIDNIAKIDEKLRKLDLIIQSSRQDREVRNSRPSIDTQKSDIENHESKLEDAYVEGSDTSQLEAELAEKRVKHEEDAEFYGNQSDRMFQSRPQSMQETAVSKRLLGVPEEELSDEMVALLDTLDGIGLSREEFFEDIKNHPFSREYEDKQVEMALERFKSKLVLQKNTERMALPNEMQKMSAELVQKTHVAGRIPEFADKFKITKKLNVAELYTVLEGKNFALDEYPVEVQEKYFTHLTRKLAEEAGLSEARNAGADIKELGKSLAEHRVYAMEDMRMRDDVEAEIKAYEKALEYEAEEESYLRTCLKDGKLMQLKEPLSSGIGTFGRYEEDRPEEWKDRKPAWPVFDYSVKYEEDKISDAGNITGRSFMQMEVWGNAMREALADLQSEFPGSREVDATEVLLAVRKAKKRMEAKLDQVRTEEEQLDMHDSYLSKVKARTFDFSS